MPNILNILTDDMFLASALIAVIRELGNFKFVVTTGNEVPFVSVSKSDDVLYLIDDRLPGNIAASFLRDDPIVILSLSVRDSARFVQFGPVVDISGPVRQVKAKLNHLIFSDYRSYRTFTPAPLSPRERQIFALLMKQWTVEKIANHLNCSEKTIYAHRMRIAHKRGAKKFFHLLSEYGMH